MIFEMIMAILFGHWVADFVCQSDDMAVGKSSSNFWLTGHVIVYSACMTMVAGFIFRDFIDTHNYKFAVAVMSWVGINFVLHWITDYITSRINSYLWRNERRHDFFVMVGADQLIHYTCLFSTYLWVLSYVK